MTWPWAFWRSFREGEGNEDGDGEDEPGADVNEGTRRNKRGTSARCTRSVYETFEFLKQHQPASGEPRLYSHCEHSGCLKNATASFKYIQPSGFLLGSRHTCEGQDQQGRATETLDPSRLLPSDYLNMFSSHGNSESNYPGK